MKDSTTKTARPAAPEHIEGEALLEWDRICTELEAVGRLDVVDRAFLTLYCETWKVWRDCMRHVATHGSVVSFPNKFPGQNPFWKNAKDCAQQLRGMLLEMGLTPLLHGDGKDEGELEI